MSSQIAWQKQIQLIAGQLSANPTNPELHAQYAQLLAQGKHVKEAVRHYEQSLNIKPSAGEVWQAYAECAALAGLKFKALHAYSIICQNLPGNMRFIQAFFELAMNLGETSQAIELLKRNLASSPNNHELRMLLVEALHNSGKSQESVEILRAGIELNPKNERFWLALALAYEDLGEKNQAYDAFNQTLTLKPNWPYALGSALNFAKSQSDSQWVEAAQRLIKRSSLQTADTANLAFGLAKYAQGIKEDQQAFDYAKKANLARRKEAGALDRHALERRVNRTITEFSKARIASLKALGNPDQRPTLIVGLPRSGTSLLEQLLASSQQVVGCGELPDLPQLTKWITEFSGAELSWPEASRKISAPLLKDAAKRYLVTLEGFSSTDTLICTDKTPANFFHLGLFISLFPNGRVIWAKRDLRDVATSIYFENFNHTQRYSTDLADIAHYAKAMTQLMKHWQETQEIPILPLEYESLIENFDQESKRIFDFLGLEWNSEIRDFHNTERSVTTPSRWQVRQPLYNTAVQRWKKHETSLAPLLNEMDKLGLK